MKGTVPLFVALCAFSWSAAAAAGNPLLEKFTTPFGVPPFDKIRLEHYLPAYREAMRQQLAAIDAITSNPAAPDFANTIEALERSGDLLAEVDNVCRTMQASATSDSLQAIAQEIAPEQAAHADAIYFNEKLFARIKAVHDRRDDAGLTGEQKRLLDKYYRAFVRGGANLDAANKARVAEINKELSTLSLTFADNVLEEVNRFALVLERKEDLAGLPAAVVDAAAETAAKRGMPGRWVFTIHKPSLIPFLQYADRRDLREKMFTAYIMQGDRGDEFDNKKILSRIASLRLERARILGYRSHADYVLEENMAKEPERVYEFLDQLWKPALERGRMEAAALQKTIDAEGGGFTLAPWDWWYYAEKLRKAEYDLDDETLRPYFRLENVVAGAFDLAGRLWGLRFAELSGVPVYNPEVRVFEVKEADGSHVGILYTDYFPRADKRGGAWSGELRGEQKVGGVRIPPVITNNGNFARPAGDDPSLLNLDEVTTMFHEFGHALQDLLAQSAYPSLSGTNVATDFVELCSQIMENWATDPEFLKTYARHYRTGAPIPQELLDRLKKSSRFNQGFETVEYLAASYLDMDWHTIADPAERDVTAFENASLGRIGLMPEIVSRYRSTYFRHIFGNGYSAGYYSYIWAAVLDADAYQAFREKGIFDRETAAAFRTNILEAGDSEDPMTLYKRFRGREPAIDPLLERRGLK